MAWIVYPRCECTNCYTISAIRVKIESRGVKGYHEMTISSSQTVFVVIGGGGDPIPIPGVAIVLLLDYVLFTYLLITGNVPAEL